MYKMSNFFLFKTKAIVSGTNFISKYIFNNEKLIFVVILI